MIVFDQYIYDEKPNMDNDVVVYHSGFCSTLPRYSYGWDTRNYYLIHYVTSGKGIYNSGDQIYHLSTHDGFLILPNASIVHTADAKDPWNVCWVAFFGRKVDEILQDANLSKDQLLFHYDKDDFLENCIKNIYNESRGRKNIAYINGQFWLFMGKLIDNYRCVQETQDKTAASFTHFEDAINYINRNIHLPVTVEELSGYLRLDPSQVYRVFKRKTGTSPQRYITQLRMEKACNLLAKTDLTIKDISEWLNFEYQSHFTKLFRNYIGVSPSHYRAQYLSTSQEQLPEP